MYMLSANLYIYMHTILAHEDADMRCAPINGETTIASLPVITAGRA